MKDTWLHVDELFIEPVSSKNFLTILEIHLYINLIKIRAYSITIVPEDLTATLWSPCAADPALSQSELTFKSPQVGEASRSILHRADITRGIRKSLNKHKLHIYGRNICVLCNFSFVQTGQMSLNYTSGEEKIKKTYRILSSDLERKTNIQHVVDNLEFRRQGYMR